MVRSEEANAGERSGLGDAAIGQGKRQANELPVQAIQRDVLAGLVRRKFVVRKHSFQRVALVILKRRADLEVFSDGQRVQTVVGQRVHLPLELKAMAVVLPGSAGRVLEVLGEDLPV